MKTWSDFLAMGGYAVYVWTSYGLAAAVIIGNALWTRWDAQKVHHELKTRLVEENACTQQESDACY